jgi:predicted ATPase
MQIIQESALRPSELVFLDRALPDALAYYRFLNLPVDKRLENALSGASYKKVFILESLPLVNDYARREDEVAQEQISNLITEVYESLPFPVAHVTVLSPTERTNFILKNLLN